MPVQTMFNYVHGNKVARLFLGDELGKKFLSCVRVNMVVYWAYPVMEKSFNLLYQLWIFFMYF